MSFLRRLVAFGFPVLIGGVACGARSELDGVPNEAGADLGMHDAMPSLQKRITAGPSHTCAINPSGALYCWGANEFGELGNGPTPATPILGSNPLPVTFDTPQPIANMAAGMVMVSAWNSGTCAIDATGATYCWGEDRYGQLGNGSMLSTGEIYVAPSAVCADTECTSQLNAVAVAGVGYYANCFLSPGGLVSCAGTNAYGEMALGKLTDGSATPQPSLITNAVALGGSTYTFDHAICAVLDSGRAVCWGQMVYSFGDGLTTDTNGSPFMVPHIVDALEVAIGNDDICVVRHDGSMFCWGDNQEGQLGDGTTIDAMTPVATTLANIGAVSMGDHFMCAVTSAGAVECIGENHQGQLGNGAPSADPTKPQTTWQTALASGAVGVACGECHACALLATGRVSCWGCNFAGQLGDGTTTSQASPVPVTGF